MIKIKPNVDCDNCNEEFVIKDELRKHPGDIEEKYFSCPHCKHEYIYLVTDLALREEQQEIKKLHDEYFRRRNAAQVRSDELKSHLETDKFIDETIKITDELE